MHAETEILLEANGKAEELFHDFLDNLDEIKFSSEQVAIRNAIQSSFSKLDYILKLFDSGHEKAMDRVEKTHGVPYTGLDQDFIGQTEVHAESFYGEAHRLKKLLLASKGFPSFKELKALPLTLIRNHVIEHTNVDRTVSSWSAVIGPRFYVGGAIREEHPTIEDRGFFPNAREFYTELIEVLKSAVEKGSS